MSVTLLAALADSMLAVYNSAAASMISGAPVINGPIVRQKIVAGVSGCRYMLSALATTSAGRKIVGGGVLPVLTGGE